MLANARAPDQVHIFLGHQAHGFPDFLVRQGRAQELDKKYEP